MSDTPDRSWNEERLVALNARCHKFGREGLKDLPLADMAMLLNAKELEFRDLPKGYNQTDRHMAERRQLELEIKDITGFFNSVLASANIFAQRFPRAFHKNQGETPKPKDRGMER